MRPMKDRAKKGKEIKGVMKTLLVDLCLFVFWTICLTCSEMSLTHYLGLSQTRGVISRTVLSLSLSFFTCKSVHPPGLMGGLKELPMNISARCLVQVTCSILSGHYHLDTQNVRTSQNLGGRESSLISWTWGWMYREIMWLAHGLEVKGKTEIRRQLKSLFSPLCPLLPTASSGFLEKMYTNSFSQDERKFLLMEYYIYILCHAACGILAPWPGIEPLPLKVKVWSLNHLTSRQSWHIV